jgi:hypothetical protein
MPPAIVRSHYLDVLNLATAIWPERFDLKVGELHAAIRIWKVVVLGPAPNLVGVARRPAVAVGAAAIWLLQVRLIFAPEVLFEDGSLDLGASLYMPLGCTKVGLIELGVVDQFPFPRGAVMKRLARVMVRRSMRFEQLAAAVG